MSGKCVLVTGGAGYVGSHTAAELLRHGFEVVVFDNLSTGHREAVPEGAAFIAGDLQRPEEIERAFETRSVSAILHFAAKSLAGESMQEPFNYLRDNTLGVINLVECAVRHGTQRFVLSSTANLFGEPDKIPIGEDCPIVPGSPYGESKHFAERILHWAERSYEFRSACLRYFNAAGADPAGARGEDHEPETHLIPRVLQVALGQHEQIKVFGTDYPTPDGTCIRDYVHVLDLAQAHVLALGALDHGSGLKFNLGNGQGFSVKEVIDTAREVTGRDIPVVEAARRPGDPAVLIASSKRIRRELGWEPKFPELGTILETAWEWHRRHPQGYSAEI
jgi:UDP-glucose 4-epimerase